MEYLASAIVDMKYHDRETPVTDPDAFERETLAELKMPREMVMRHRSPQFGHIFSSDSYSAGYYSYLWSETMDADTWEAFKATGNPYDLSLVGRGWFQIQSPNGETLYSRAGAFNTNETGQLVTIDVLPLEPAITVPTEAIEVTVSTTGQIFAKLEAQSSKFGSQLQIVQTRQEFTKNMVATLEDGASALTDADTNEEAANLATLQTRQSLIVSSLSISTSSEQNILQLLR